MDLQSGKQRRLAAGVVDAATDELQAFARDQCLRLQVHLAVAVLPGNLHNAEALRIDISLIRQGNATLEYALVSQQLDQPRAACACLLYTS